MFVNLYAVLLQLFFRRVASVGTSPRLRTYLLRAQTVECSMRHERSNPIR